jgi:hypothetical protein
MSYIVKQHQYFNADRDRIVDVGSPEAAFLAFVPGDELTDTDAKKWGLLPASKPDPEKPDPEPEEKMIRTSPRNKMGSAVPNKGASKDDEIL